MVPTKDLRKLLLVGVYVLGILGIVASGGGGSSGDDEWCSYSYSRWILPLGFDIKNFPFHLDRCSLMPHIIDY